MNEFVSQKDLKKRCENPCFCIACFRIRDKVDEHHVCEECRRGSMGMPRRLRVITLQNGKSYFVDDRLQELRNIHNLHDRIYFKDLEEMKGGGVA